MRVIFLLVLLSLPVRAIFKNCAVGEQVITKAGWGKGTKKKKKACCSICHSELLRGFLYTHQDKMWEIKRIWFSTAVSWQIWKDTDIKCKALSLVWLICSIHRCISVLNQISSVSQSIPHLQPKPLNTLQIWNSTSSSPRQAVYSTFEPLSCFLLAFRDKCPTWMKALWPGLLMQRQFLSPGVKSAFGF